MIAASKLVAYVKLGRISNLPTVWTNALAGAVLARADGIAVVAPAAVAASLFYCGGMVLNDAFDARIDALQRPERPIPAGLVGVGEAFAVGATLLASGLSLVVATAARAPTGAWQAVVLAVALAALVLVYDAWHKTNPAGPIVMGACRALVYAMAAALAAGAAARHVAGPAVALVAYVVGLTEIAKRESRGPLGVWWPVALLCAPVVRVAIAVTPTVVTLAAALGFVAWTLAAVSTLRRGVPPGSDRAIARLIAGISLVDALAIAASGAPGAAGLAAVAALGTPATLLLQRRVRGT